MPPGVRPKKDVDDDGDDDDDDDDNYLNTGVEESWDPICRNNLDASCGAISWEEVNLEEDGKGETRDRGTADLGTRCTR